MIVAGELRRQLSKYWMGQVCALFSENEAILLALLSHCKYEA